MEGTAFITVVHPVGSLDLCSLGVFKFMPMYSPFKNMNVHVLVTRSEALGRHGLAVDESPKIGDVGLGLA